jgi:opacity protein-like surface antigen
MKRKLLLSLIGATALVSASSYAGTMGEIASPERGGWVIGGDIGYGYLSTQEEDILTPVPFSTPLSTEIALQKHHIGNLVGGGYVGYAFPVFERLLMGPEVGYKYLGQSKYRSFGSELISGNFLRNHIKVTQQAGDFLLAARLYVSPRFSLIAKAGGAYVYTKTRQENQFFLSTIRGGLNTKASFWRIKPEFSLGAGFGVTSKLDFNVIYTHIGGADANVTGSLRFYNSGPDRTPAVFEYNAITAGLSYTFG